MKNKIAAVVLVCLWMASVAWADARQIPAVIMEGLAVYDLHDVQAALKKWAKGGPLEGDDLEEEARALSEAEISFEYRTRSGMGFWGQVRVHDRQQKDR